MSEWWSWGLEAGTAGAMWWSGRNRAGWVFALVVDVFWALYGVLSHQLGFTAFSLVFAPIYLRNALKDKKAGEC